MHYKEYIAKNATAYGKNCFGCKNNERDIMLSFIRDQEKIEILDVFLTNEQAREFAEKILNTLEANETNI
jgi:hypothetical protein